MHPNTVHRLRLDRLRARLEDIGAEGILIGSSHNRRWLSGFRGSSGWLLITADRAILATDFRYWQQAVAESPQFELFKLLKKVTQVELVQGAAPSRLAIESQHTSVKDFHTLQRISGIDWIQADGLIEDLRATKDPLELEKIQSAAAITDATMSKVKDLVRTGMSELQLAWALEKTMREAGATGLTFPVHVASGPNAALPHHAPGTRTIAQGDILLVDMGASVDGYGSDLSRTFLLASEMDEAFEERYNLVLQAHDAAIRAIAPGKRGIEIDAVARNMIAGGGYGENFGHGLGHGVGLEGHEQPRLSMSGADALLMPAMVTTVEPGIYIEGWGGIRIENLIHITEDGAEVLSHCPEQPLLALE